MPLLDQILAMNLSDNELEDDYTESEDDNAEHEQDNAESDSSTQSDLEELLNN